MIHLLCGVPGSGKTWVAKQLSQFNHLPHDDYPVAIYHSHLIRAARETKPVLAEAPFRISILIEQLREHNIPVKTYYITDAEHLIKKRYEARDQKPYPKQHSTNLKKYDLRDWDFKGTPEQILNILRSV